MPRSESVLGRSLRVLEAFGGGELSLTMSEVARETGLSTSTTHRLITELVSVGALEHTGQRDFRLGRRIWEIASRSYHELQDAALPHMQQLNARVGNHVLLSVLDGDEVLYLQRSMAPASDVISMARPGFRLPALACAPGLVLVAYADAETRERIFSAPHTRFTPSTVTDELVLSAIVRAARSEGFSSAVGWTHLQTTGVAVPILSDEHTAIAALSVVIPADSAPEPFVPFLTAAARRIARAYGQVSKARSEPGLNKLSRQLRASRRLATTSQESQPG